MPEKVQLTKVASGRKPTAESVPAKGTKIVDKTPGGENIWACSSCDWMAVLEPNQRPYRHVCGQETEIRTFVPLGDAIEKLLTSYGITQEWWKAFKHEHGLPPMCNCDERKEWFNRLSEKLPPGLGWVVTKLLETLTRKGDDNGG